MVENKNIIIVMGVSGSGKSTVAKALSKKLGYQFIEGDEFHSKSNINKMKNGIPLSDKERLPWLRDLSKILLKFKSNGKVLACSALKESYRKILSKNIPANSLIWIYLRCGIKILEKRINRRDHFMPKSLLKSQIDSLEEPEDAIYIKDSLTIKQQVEDIIKRMYE